MAIVSSETPNSTDLVVGKSFLKEPTPADLRERGLGLLNEAQAMSDRRLRRLLQRQALELAEFANMREAEALSKPWRSDIRGHSPQRQSNDKRKAPPKRG